MPLYIGLKDHWFGAAGEWNLSRCPKKHCGLIWLDPMPLEEEIGKAYTRYHTHNQPRQARTLFRRLYDVARNGYLQTRFGYTRGVGSRWHRYLRAFAYLNPGGASALDASCMFLPAPGPDAVLLDVGCGAGELLVRMGAMGWRVYGIDFDPKAVDAARSKGIPVGLGTLQDQRFPDRYFDAIYMGHVIEHVHDPVTLLRECHRILKVKGTIVILTPNAESWGHQLYKEAWRGLEPPRHLHLFCPTSLSRLVEKAEFSVQRQMTVATGPGILAMSDALRLARDSDWKPSFGPSFFSKLRGHIYQMWERILLASGKPHAGEEIVITATMSPGSAISERY